MRKNYYLVMSLAAVAALSSCKKLGELSADRCLPLSTVNFPRSI